MNFIPLEEKQKKINEHNDNILLIEERNGKIRCKCTLDNYTWEANWSNISKGKGCPVCRNRKVIKGVNDVNTTDPNIKLFLAEPEEGELITRGSNKKVKTKCPICNTSDSKVVYDMVKHGYSCKACGDGVSLPEKFIRSLLTQVNIEFNFQKKFIWSNKFIYDFYIPDYCFLIEVHGIQHYEERNNWGRGLESEESIDADKRELAISNGLAYYEVDARYSELKHLGDSAERLFKRLGIEISENHLEVAWESAQNSLAVESWKLWDSKSYTIKEIASELKLATTTIIRYLNSGSALNMCTYSGKARQKDSGRRQGKRNIKAIMQYTKDGDFIKEYRSLSEASTETGFTMSSISLNCSGKTKTSHGYVWACKKEGNTNGIE